MNKTEKQIYAANYAFDTTMYKLDIVARLFILYTNLA